LIIGKGVSDGIAIGRLTVYKKNNLKFDAVFDGEARELERFRDAIAKVKDDLEKEIALLKEAVDGETGISLLTAYKTMLDDPMVNDMVKSFISIEHISCENAVCRARDEIRHIFEGMDDEYMSARAADVSDVSDRLLVALTGAVIDHNISDDAIILADDLTPSETMHLDKSKVRAFVTTRGSGLSHTAILAKSYGIPAMVGVNFEDSFDCKPGIVDAYLGRLIVDPDEDTLKMYQERIAELDKKAKNLEELRLLDAQTTYGTRIGLLANVGSLEEIETAVNNGCDGVGLFRSEFIYLNSSDYPTEDEQYEVYSRAVELLGGKELTIRTMDLGGDKTTPYMDMKEEDNPTLGMRAIRYCLGHKDIFKTQLKAVYRAAAHGPVSLLFPMIISIEEIWQIKSIIAEVKEYLDRQGISYGECRLGIMIETPAAAMISDLLAKEVDFFSIGTNDLTQYTLAVDRQNTELEFICDYHHQAIIRMMKMIIDNGHEGGCKVCVCGELASDTSFTRDLVVMGVDELSVAPSMLYRVKQAVRNC